MGGQKGDGVGGGRDWTMFSGVGGFQTVLLSASWFSPRRKTLVRRQIPVVWLDFERGSGEQMDQRGCVSETQYKTTQYSTIQYNTLQYGTIQCSAHTPPKFHEKTPREREE